MAEELLDDAQIGSPLEQMRREGMTERMRTDAEPDALDADATYRRTSRSPLRTVSRPPR